MRLMNNQFDGTVHILDSNPLITMIYKFKIKKPKENNELENPVFKQFYLTPMP